MKYSIILFLHYMTSLSNQLYIFITVFLRHQPLILSIILNSNTVFGFYFNYRLDFDMWCIDNCQELETGTLPIYVCLPFFVIRNLTCEK